MFQKMVCEDKININPMKPELTKILVMSKLEMMPINDAINEILKLIIIDKDEIKICPICEKHVLINSVCPSCTIELCTPIKI